MLCYLKINFSKSLIDAIYENYGDDDNNVCETKCTRIGTCEEYKDGMIRYRMYTNWHYWLFVRRDIPHKIIFYIYKIC